MSVFVLIRVDPWTLTRRPVPGYTLFRYPAQSGEIEVKKPLIASLFLFLVITPLALAVALPNKDMARADAQKIQGRWNLIYAECGGTDVTKKVMGYWQVVTFEATALIRPNGGSYHANPRDNFLSDPYQLDSSKNPKGIVIKEADGATKGWYVLDGDCLILRLAIDYTTRQRRNASKTLLVLRRPPA
jgi:uncharacterized protein (TIGR03067 family)